MFGIHPRVISSIWLHSKWFTFLPQDKESSSAGSSQSSPFDTPLNTALNIMKNKDKLTKPTTAGRVAGKGLSTKWGSYYTASVRKEKKTSSESQTREVEELKAQVARIPELVQEQVEQQLGTKLNAMVPTLIHGLTTWIAGGQKGPPPIPSFTASNSHNTQAAPLVSPAAAVLVSTAAASLVSPAAAVLVSPTPALELNAPGCGKNTPAGTSAASGPSITCTSAVGGASTLAELDGITVTKPLGQ